MENGQWLALVWESGIHSHEVFGALEMCKIPYAWAGGTDRVETMSFMLMEGLSTRAEGFILLASDLLVTADALDKLIASVEENDFCVSGICPIGVDELGQTPPSPDQDANWGLVQCDWGHTFFCAFSRSAVENVCRELQDQDITESPNSRRWFPFWMPFVAETQDNRYEYFCPDRAFWWRMSNFGGARLWLDTGNRVERIREVQLASTGCHA